MLDFSTFDAYCQEKWGFKKRRAYDLIESAETVVGLPEKSFTIVNNEGQARALAEIRDAKLYRVHFSTFDAYCQEKWGFKRRRADELIQGAAVAGALAEVSGMPLNARQATAGALSDEKCSMVHNPHLKSLRS